MTRTLSQVLSSPPGKPIPPPDTTATLRAFARGRAPLDSRQAAQFFTDLFDQLAATWDTSQATGRDEPLRDALTRAGPLPTGLCLEIGSGTGAHAPLLTTAFPTMISLGLSAQMLHRAARRPPVRIRADAAALPIADATIATVVAIDMLLFPSEIARVLAPGCVLLWSNQLGSDGPPYLPTAAVASALPGHWHTTEAEAGASRAARTASAPVNAACWWVFQLIE